jgi:hypothetical protein
MPKRRATSSIDSGKLTFSCSIANLNTSPPTPQPKQWKAPRSGFTLKLGVFSWWNGHRPLYDVPIFLSCTCSDTYRTMSAVRRTSSTKLSGKGIYSRSSTTVTPPRPSDATLTLATWGCPSRNSDTARRRIPCPNPWITRS